MSQFDKIPTFLRVFKFDFSRPTAAHWVIWVELYCDVILGAGRDAFKKHLSVCASFKQKISFIVCYSQPWNINSPIVFGHFHLAYQNLCTHSSFEFPTSTLGMTSQMLIRPILPVARWWNK